MGWQTHHKQLESANRYNIFSNHFIYPFSRFPKTLSLINKFHSLVHSIIIFYRCESCRDVNDIFGIPSLISVFLFYIFQSSNDNLSEEQIKKIVENCKDSTKDKEPKAMTEVSDSKKEPEKVEQKPDTPVDMDVEEPQENESNKKNEKKEKKKNKEKKEKKPKKEKPGKEKKGDKAEKMDEDSDVMPGNAYQPPPSMLKETELKGRLIVE